MMCYVIIGGGIAGISAAKAIRENDLEGEITIYTNQFHPLGLYDRRMLARKLSDGTYESEEVLLETPEQLAHQNITFEYHDIERIFPASREILKAHNIRRSFDKLLLATGAIPRLIDVPGLHYIGVHQLRTPDDMTLIFGWLPELQDQGAVIVGGGILALDVAWALVRQDIPVTMVVRESSVGTPLLSAPASKLVYQQLQADGVRVILNDQVDSFISSDEKLLDGVLLHSGEFIAARMALCAIGVHPDAELAEGTPIATGHKTGAILVSNSMETRVEGIFAAGNCAQIEQSGFIARNWTASAAQGRIAGQNMVEDTKRPIAQFYPFMSADLTSQIYGMPLAYFGDFDAIQGITEWAWSDSNAQAITVRLREGHILGASILGNMTEAANLLLEMYKDGERFSADQLLETAI